MYDVGGNKYKKSSVVELHNNLNGLNNIENVSKEGFNFADNTHLELLTISQISSVWGNSTISAKKSHI